MSKNYICIWSNDNASEMAKFYKSVFKDTKIGATSYWGPNPMDIKEGAVLTIELTVRGQKIMLLNGFVPKEFNDSFSMTVPCKPQREIDTYWKKLSSGGQPVQCGWVIDKYGIRWQVFPDQIMKWQTSKNKKKRQAMNEAMWQMVKLDAKKLKEAYDRA